MGIFEKVTTELLEKAKLLSLAECQEIAEMISKPEVDKLLKEENTVMGILSENSCIPWKEGSKFFPVLRDNFCETVSEKFLTGNTVRMVEKVKESRWYALSANLEAFKSEIILYTETPGKNFLEGHLEGVKKKCFEQLLAESNLLSWSSWTISDFLEKNIDDKRFTEFLVKSWTKTLQRGLLIEICFGFSSNEDTRFKWYAEPFLSEKIRLGDCDEFLSAENLSNSEVFGPVVAARVLRLAQEKFEGMKQDFE